MVAKKKKKVKKIAKKSIKKTAVRKVVKKSAKKAVIKKTKKVAKKTSRKAVKKPTKKTAKKPVKKVVKKSTKKPVKKLIKRAASAKAPKRQKVTAKPTRRPRATRQLIMKKQTTGDETTMTVTEEVKVQVPRSIAQPMESQTHTTIEQKSATLLGALEFRPYQSRADEEYMNEAQREHFFQILQAWRQELMQDVDLTVGHLKEEAESYADPVDRAAQEEGFNLELRTRDRERKLIKKIEQSLDLLSNGDYGFCEDCGTEIGIRRLEARPTAMKCIDCKTFQEIREKQMGG